MFTNKHEKKGGRENTIIDIPKKEKTISDCKGYKGGLKHLLKPFYFV